MNTCLQYFFVIFNLLFVAGGALSVAFATWIRFAPAVNQFIEIDDYGEFLFYGFLVVGATLLFVGLCGMFGACYEKTWILGIYIGIIAIFILAEVTAIVYTFIPGNVQLVPLLQTLWANLKNETKYEVQRTFSCCGYLNASEWNGQYHLSCLNTTTINNMTSPSIPWNDSCSSSILQFFEMNIWVLGGLVGSLLAFQLFQVITSALLIRSIFLSNRVDTPRKYSGAQKHSREQEIDGEVNQVCEIESSFGDR